MLQRLVTFQSVKNYTYYSKSHTATSLNLIASGTKNDQNGHKIGWVVQCYLAQVNHSLKHAFICIPTKHMPWSSFTLERLSKRITMTTATFAVFMAVIFLASFILTVVQIAPTLVILAAPALLMNLGWIIFASLFDNQTKLCMSTLTVGYGRSTAGVVFRTRWVGIPHRDGNQTITWLHDV